MYVCADTRRGGGSKAEPKADENDRLLVDWLVDDGRNVLQQQQERKEK
jgi:hypothetical protein